MATRQSNTWTNLDVICQQYLSNRARYVFIKKKQAPLAKRLLWNSLSALVNDQDVLEVETGLDDKVDGALERKETGTPWKSGSSAAFCVRDRFEYGASGMNDS